MRRPPEYRHPVKGDDTPVHGQIDVKHIRPRDAGLNSNLFSRKAKDKQYRRTPESVGITIASYYKRSEDATYIGIACCGRGDNFSKHKGRELARSRSTDKEEYLIVKGFRTFDEIIRYICLYSQHITPFYKKLLISYARKKKLGKAE
jgi:hypothetical protein